MNRPAVAPLPVALALIAALCTSGAGCSQLLGVSELTAADRSDGSITDATNDGDLSNDGGDGDDALANDTADRGADDASDGAIDGAFNDSPDRVDAVSCSQDLSNVHTGDFLISFTMQTNQTDSFIALVNQRTVCVGLGLFWDAMLVNQHIRLEVAESADQSRYSTLTSSGNALNDNVPHRVVITRTSNLVKMVIDDQLVGSKTMDQNLGALPPLLVGSGHCVVVPIKEAITNACVRPN